MGTPVSGTGGFMLGIGHLAERNSFLSKEECTTLYSPSFG